jgi:hypothetical protein
MTGFDPTTVLPVVVGALPDRSRRAVGYNEEQVDELLADLAVPVPDRPSLGDRAAAVVREVTSTPRRAAACTAWIFAVVVLTAVWLEQPTVSVQTSLGPAKSSCGIDIFFYGYPDPAISRACRHAEAAHFGLFVPALLLVVAGLVAAAVVTLRRPGDTDGTGSTIRSALRRAPIRSGLVSLGVLAVVVGAFALRPAPVQLVHSGVVLTAHCGADAYFFGYPDATIHAACQHAYGGQAHLLIVAIIVAAIGLGALAQIAYTHAADRLARQGLALIACAVILAVIAIVAIEPLSVGVNEGPAPVVAACGLDTFVAGYPDHAVEHACRAHFATHAAVGSAAGTLAMLIIAWGVVILSRRRRSAIHADLEASL